MTNRQRKGLSLLEVLVAIFVMGVGTISILVLFPLGALTMAEAIKSDRTQQVSANAAAFARYNPIREDGTGKHYGQGVNNDDDDQDGNHKTSVSDADRGKWVSYAFNYPDDPDDPGDAGRNAVPAGSGGAPPLPGSNQPSYPVFIDPIGWYLHGCDSSRNARWVGSTQIPRRIMPPVNSLTDAMRQFVFLDDLVFGANGAPASQAIEREGRFSWAYLCRRVAAGNAANGTQLSVVVYERRPLRANVGGTNVGESRYKAEFHYGSRNATLKLDAGNLGTWPPPVKKGAWILDGSYPTYNHGYFYRVVAVSEPGPDSLDVELHIPARANAPENLGSPGLAVIMDHVVDVLERGTN